MGPSRSPSPRRFGGGTPARRRSAPSPDEAAAFELPSGVRRRSAPYADASTPLPSSYAPRGGRIATLSRLATAHARPQRPSRLSQVVSSTALDDLFRGESVSIGQLGRQTAERLRRTSSYAVGMARKGGGGGGPGAEQEGSHVDGGRGASAAADASGGDARETAGAPGAGTSTTAFRAPGRDDLETADSSTVDPVPFGASLAGIGRYTEPQPQGDVSAALFASSASPRRYATGYPSAEAVRSRRAEGDSRPRGIFRTSLVDATGLAMRVRGMEGEEGTGEAAERDAHHTGSFGVGRGAERTGSPGAAREDQQTQLQSIPVTAREEPQAQLQSTLEDEEPFQLLSLTDDQTSPVFQEGRVFLDLPFEKRPPDTRPGSPWNEADRAAAAAQAGAAGFSGGGVVSVSKEGDFSAPWYSQVDRAGVRPAPRRSDPLVGAQDDSQPAPLPLSRIRFDGSRPSSALFDGYRSLAPEVGRVEESSGAGPGDAGPPRAVGAPTATATLPPPVRPALRPTWSGLTHSASGVFVPLNEDDEEYAAAAQLAIERRLAMAQRGELGEDDDESAMYVPGADPEGLGTDLAGFLDDDRDAGGERDEGVGQGAAGGSVAEQREAAGAVMEREEANAQGGFYGRDGIGGMVMGEEAEEDREDGEGAGDQEFPRFVAAADEERQLDEVREETLRGGEEGGWRFGAVGDKGRSADKGAAGAAPRAAAAANAAAAASDARAAARTPPVRSPALSSPAIVPAGALAAGAATASSPAAAAAAAPSSACAPAVGSTAEAIADRADTAAVLNASTGPPLRSDAPARRVAGAAAPCAPVSLAPGGDLERQPASSVSRLAPTSSSPSSSPPSPRHRLARHSKTYYEAYKARQAYAETHPWAGRVRELDERLDPNRAEEFWADAQSRKEAAQSWPGGWLWPSRSLGAVNKIIGMIAGRGARERAEQAEEEIRGGGARLERAVGGGIPALGQAARGSTKARALRLRGKAKSPSRAPGAEGRPAARALAEGIAGPVSASVPGHVFVPRPEEPHSGVEVEVAPAGLRAAQHGAAHSVEQGSAPLPAPAPLAASVPKTLPAHRSCSPPPSPRHLSHAHSSHVHPSAAHPHTRVPSFGRTEPSIALPHLARRPRSASPRPPLPRSRSESPRPPLSRPSVHDAAPGRSEAIGAADAAWGSGGIAAAPRASTPPGSPGPLESPGRSFAPRAAAEYPPEFPFRSSAPVSLLPFLPSFPAASTFRPSAPPCSPPPPRSPSPPPTSLPRPHTHMGFEEPQRRRAMREAFHVPRSSSLRSLASSAQSSFQNLARLARIASPSERILASVNSSMRALTDVDSSVEDLVAAEREAEERARANERAKRRERRRRARRRQEDSESALESSDEEDEEIERRRKGDGDAFGGEGDGRHHRHRRHHRRRRHGASTGAFEDASRGRRGRAEAHEANASAPALYADEDMEPASRAPSCRDGASADRFAGGGVRGGSSGSLGGDPSGHRGARGGSSADLFAETSCERSRGSLDGAEWDEGGDVSDESGRDSSFTGGDTMLGAEASDVLTRGSSSGTLNGHFDRHESSGSIHPRYPCGSSGDLRSHHQRGSSGTLHSHHAHGSSGSLGSRRHGSSGTLRGHSRDFSTALHPLPEDARDAGPNAIGDELPRFPPVEAATKLSKAASDGFASAHPANGPRLEDVPSPLRIDDAAPKRAASDSARRGAPMRDSSPRRVARAPSGAAFVAAVAAAADAVAAGEANIPGVASPVPDRSAAPVALRRPPSAVHVYPNIRLLGKPIFAVRAWREVNGKQVVWSSRRQRRGVCMPHELDPQAPVAGWWRSLLTPERDFQSWWTLMHWLVGFLLVLGAAVFFFSGVAVLAPRVRESTSRHDGLAGLAAGLVYWPCTIAAIFFFFPNGIVSFLEVVNADYEERYEAWRVRCLWEEDEEAQRRRAAAREDGRSESESESDSDSETGSETGTESSGLSSGSSSVPAKSSGGASVAPGGALGRSSGSAPLASFPGKWGRAAGATAHSAGPSVRARDRPPVRPPSPSSPAHPSLSLSSPRAAPHRHSALVDGLATRLHRSSGRGGGSHLPGDLEPLDELPQSVLLTFEQDRPPPLHPDLAWAETEPGAGRAEGEQGREGRGREDLESGGGGRGRGGRPVGGGVAEVEMARGGDGGGNGEGRADALPGSRLPGSEEPASRSLPGHASARKPQPSAPRGRRSRPFGSTSTFLEGLLRSGARRKAEAASQTGESSPGPAPKAGAVVPRAATPTTRHYPPLVLRLGRGSAPMNALRHPVRPRRLPPRLRLWKFLPRSLAWWAISIQICGKLGFIAANLGRLINCALPETLLTKFHQQLLEGFGFTFGSCCFVITWVLLCLENTGSVWRGLVPTKRAQLTAFSWNATFWSFWGSSGYLLNSMPAWYTTWPSGKVDAFHAVGGAFGSFALVVAGTMMMLEWSNPRHA